MLEKEILGNTLEHWGISILIVIGAYLIMKVVSLFANKVIKPLTKKTSNQLDDIIFDSVLPPLLYGIMLLGLWIAIHRLAAPDSIIKAVHSAYKILVALNVTWLFARFADGMIEEYWAGSSKDTQRHRMTPIIRSDTG